jgi:hypothetical protein
MKMGKVHGRLAGADLAADAVMPCPPLLVPSAPMGDARMIAVGGNNLANGSSTLGKGEIIEVGV